MENFNKRVAQDMWKWYEIQISVSTTFCQNTALPAAQVLWCVRLQHQSWAGKRPSRNCKARNIHYQVSSKETARRGGHIMEDCVCPGIQGQWSHVVSLAWDGGADTRHCWGGPKYECQEKRGRERRKKNGRKGKKKWIRLLLYRWKSLLFPLSVDCQKF